MRIALGFKLHTGWAALVALAGEPSKLDIVLRRRVELLPEDESIPRFVYHQAAEMELAAAAKLIQSAKNAAAKAASLAIQSSLKALEGGPANVHIAAIVTGSSIVPDELSAVLSSHALIHAAEGVLFQRAVAAGCEKCGVGVISIRERELWPRAASACGMTETRLRQRVDGVKKSIGAPWGADQKAATAAAFVALHGVKAPQKSYSH